jgi:hypothetical protein
MSREILDEIRFTLRARAQVFSRGDFEDFLGRRSRPFAKTDKL